MKKKLLVIIDECLPYRLCDTMLSIPKTPKLSLDVKHLAKNLLMGGNRDCDWVHVVTQRSKHIVIISGDRGRGSGHDGAHLDELCREKRIAYVCFSAAIYDGGLKAMAPAVSACWPTLRMLPTRTGQGNGHCIRFNDARTDYHTERLWSGTQDT